MEKNLANIDRLTKLANPRYLKPYLPSEWQRLTEEVVPIALILCDVDCLKAYNDVYGFPEGDRCLQQIAEVIRETSLKSPGSLPARYGGEEFALILPNTDAIAAMAVAENICKNVRSMKIPHSWSKVSSKIVTISLGIACTIPQAEMPHDELWRAADEALDNSKEMGRDRFTLSETFNYQFPK